MHSLSHPNKMVARRPEDVAAQWVVVLGILLAASLLANLFLLVTR